MKNFWNGIAIWFLVQLVFASGVGAMKQLQHLQGSYGDSYITDCKQTNPALGLLVGLAMPITAFTFVEAGWCWE